MIKRTLSLNHIGKELEEGEKEDLFRDQLRSMKGGGGPGMLVSAGTSPVEYLSLIRNS